MKAISQGLLGKKSHAGMSLPLYQIKPMTKFFLEKNPLFSKKSNIFEENHSSTFFLARPQAPSIIQQFTKYESNRSRTSLEKVYDKVFFIFAKNGIFFGKNEEISTNFL